MWRFKPSKYKNAVPKVPKKGEGWITDISVASLPSFGNHIKASATMMAFNIDSAGGGNLGVLSLNDTGSKNKDLPILYAHSEFITDFDFCPYDDEILVTGSQDQHVKLWRITENSLKSNVPCNPEVDILTSNKIEVLKFHPQVDCIVTTVEDSTIHLWDINKKQSIYADSSHEDTVQSISWRHSGDVLASCGKDKKLRLWDPRDSSKNQVATSHSNNRDTRVVWLGDTEQILTTGFGSGREREVLLRDIRRFTEHCAPFVTSFSMSSDDFPNFWKAALVLFVFGLALLTATLLASLSCCCVQSVFRKSVFTVAGTLQAIAGIMFILALVLYPAGWGSRRIQMVCSNKVGPYYVGDCTLGWTYFLSIVGTIVTFICSALSIQAESSTSSTKVQEGLMEGRNVICLI